MEFLQAPKSSKDGSSVEWGNNKMPLISVLDRVMFHLGPVGQGVSIPAAEALNKADVYSVTLPECCTVEVALTAVLARLRKTELARTKFEVIPNDDDHNNNNENNNNNESNKENKEKEKKEKENKEKEDMLFPWRRRYLPGWQEKKTDRFASLPFSVVTRIFSFVPVRDHFRFLYRVSWRYARVLYRRAAWPNKLEVREVQGAVHLENPASGAVPAEALARLARLGFERIEGGGRQALAALANPRTRVMHFGQGLQMTREAMRPLECMTMLREIELRCNGSEDAGLMYMSGLSVSTLAIQGANDDDDNSKAKNQKKDMDNDENQDKDKDKDKERQYMKLRATMLSGLFMPLKSLKLTFLDIKGMLSALSGLNIQQLDLSHTTVCDDDLQDLTGLPVRQLDLTACPGLTNGAWKHLAEISSLRELRLGSSNLKLDMSAGALKQLPHLSALCLLEVESLTKQGLQALTFLPHLRHLDLSGSPIADTELPILCAAPLKKLRLANCRNLSTTGFAAFELQAPTSPVQGLEEVDFSGTQLTLTDLNGIIRLPKLRTVDVYACPLLVDDAVAVEELVEKYTVMIYHRCPAPFSDFFSNPEDLTRANTNATNTVTETYEEYLDKFASRTRPPALPPSLARLLNPPSFSLMESDKEIMKKLLPRESDKKANKENQENKMKPLPKMEWEKLFASTAKQSVTGTASNGKSVNGTASNGKSVGATAGNGESVGATASNGKSVGATASNGKSVDATASNGKSVDATASNGTSVTGAASNGSNGSSPDSADVEEKEMTSQELLGEYIKASEEVLEALEEDKPQNAFTALMEKLEKQEKEKKERKEKMENMEKEKKEKEKKEKEKEEKKEKGNLTPSETTTPKKKEKRAIGSATASPLKKKNKSANGSVSTSPLKCVDNADLNKLEVTSQSALKPLSSIAEFNNNAVKDYHFTSARLYTQVMQQSKLVPAQSSPALPSVALSTQNENLNKILPNSASTSGSFQDAPGHAGKENMMIAKCASYTEGQTYLALKHPNLDLNPLPCTSGPEGHPLPQLSASGMLEAGLDQENNRTVSGSLSLAQRYFIDTWFCYPCGLENSKTEMACSRCQAPQTESVALKSPSGTQPLSELFDQVQRQLSRQTGTISDHEASLDETGTISDHDTSLDETLGDAFPSAKKFPMLSDGNLLRAPVPADEDDDVDDDFDNEAQDIESGQSTARKLTQSVNRTDMKSGSFLTNVTHVSRALIEQMRFLVISGKDESPDNSVSVDDDTGDIFGPEDAIEDQEGEEEDNRDWRHRQNSSRDGTSWEHMDDPGDTEAYV